MIPKKIHYCWFGGNKLTKNAIKCIKSWKQFYPEYEIIEWNESNFDVNCCKYVKEAYSHKKWAFVSDFARFWIIYNFGGIYFDTDILVIKSANKSIVDTPFFGREQERDGGTINPGLGFGSEKGNFLCRCMLDSYLEDSFINIDGSENTYTVGQRLMNVFEKLNIKLQDTHSSIETYCDWRIYPAEYFCPMGYDGVLKITKNTCSIHLYDASWLPDKIRKKMKLNQKINNSKASISFLLKVYRKIYSILLNR